MNLVIVFFILAISQFTSIHSVMIKEEYLNFEESSAKNVSENGRIIGWYNATLTCHHPEFCASVWYMEDDIQIDDQLVFVGLHCTNTTELQHLVMVIFEGDDTFLFDSQYEPIIIVKHDCGQKEKLTHVEFSLPPVGDATKGRTFYHDYTKSLSEGGEIQNRNAFTKFHQAWPWPINYWTEAWINMEDMNEFPELYDPIILYWYKDNENEPYFLCIKSLAEDESIKHCEFFEPKSYSILDDENFWRNMMQGLIW